MGRSASGRTSSACRRSRLARSAADRAVRDGRLLVLLARGQGLLGCRPAREQGVQRRASDVLHPAFDYESRIVTAAIAAASRWRRSTCRTAARTSTPRCASSRRWTPSWCRRTRRGSGSSSAVTSISRGPTSMCIRRSESLARSVSSGRARDSRASARTGAGGHGAGARPDERPDVHMVGAVAEHASAQHWLEARLHPCEPDCFPIVSSPAPFIEISVPAITRPWWPDSTCNE